jgi:hypothetical protein
MSNTNIDIKKIYEKKENEKLLYEYLNEKPIIKPKKIKQHIENGIPVYLECDEGDDDKNHTNNKK